MPPSTRKGKWYASLIFYWECPECGLQLLEGNPTKCPHQNGGPKAQYNPARDGRVTNWEEVRARCGDGKKGKKEEAEKVLDTSPPITLDDLLKAECPKGG